MKEDGKKRSPRIPLTPEEVAELIEIKKIREFNKIRVGYKNDVVEVFGEGYKDIKMNHASSNG